MKLSSWVQNWMDGYSFLNCDTNAPIVSPIIIKSFTNGQQKNTSFRCFTASAGITKVLRHSVKK